METNASNYVYGVILSQKAEDGKQHPVVFYLKSMKPVERNYGISDQEALAIIKALQHWRHWLEGTSFLVSGFASETIIFCQMHMYIQFYRLK